VWSSSRWVLDVLKAGLEGTPCHVPVGRDIP